MIQISPVSQIHVVFCKFYATMDCVSCVLASAFALLSLVAKYRIVLSTRNVFMCVKSVYESLCVCAFLPSNPGWEVGCVNIEHIPTLLC